MRRLNLLPLLVLLSCKGGGETDDTDVDPGYQPDLACPGAEGCLTADGALQAGAGTMSILPTCFEDWIDLNDDQEYDKRDEEFRDCGCDKLCPGDDGYTAADEGEADGEFQVVWMAGFQHSRAAMGVRDVSTGLRDIGEGDGLWAKTAVFRQGDSTVAIVALDLVGYFYEPGVARIRELAAERNLDVDLIVVHSTHVHEGPDTMGIWGPNLVTTGVNDDYYEYVAQQAAASIEEAVGALTPVATMHVGSVDSTSYSDRGTRGIVNDTRDPYVVDERVGGARFVDGSGQTILSLINFGNHPETTSDENLLLTSDFVHAARKGVEDGIHFDSFDKDGVGGTAIYINSTVGGMMTPLRQSFVDHDGAEWSASSFEKADTVGMRIAEVALDAMGSESTEVAEPALAFRSKTYFLTMENLAFQAMYLTGVLNRPAYNYDETMPMSDDNRPQVFTEVDVVEIGPLQMVTVPGELFPEALVGGYDGSHINTPDVEIFEADNPNPPDIANAPTGPYLIDHFTLDHRWVIGMGNDELGYFIPKFNFEVDPIIPYVEEAPGDHYEETNSLGPEAADAVVEECRQLLQWTP